MTTPEYLSPTELNQFQHYLASNKAVLCSIEAYRETVCWDYGEVSHTEESTTSRKLILEEITRDGFKGTLVEGTRDGKPGTEFGYNFPPRNPYSYSTGFADVTEGIHSIQFTVIEENVLRQLKRELKPDQYNIMGNLQKSDKPDYDWQFEMCSGGEGFYWRCLFHFREEKDKVKLYVETGGGGSKQSHDDDDVDDMALECVANAVRKVESFFEDHYRAYQRKIVVEPAEYKMGKSTIMLSKAGQVTEEDD